MDNIRYWKPLDNESEKEENKMQDVAIVSFVQSDCVRHAGAQNEVELIMPVVQAALKEAG